MEGQDYFDFFPFAKHVSFPGNVHCFASKRDGFLSPSFCLCSIVSASSLLASPVVFLFSLSIDWYAKNARFFKFVFTFAKPVFLFLTHIFSVFDDFCKYSVQATKAFPLCFQAAVKLSRFRLFPKLRFIRSLDVHVVYVLKLRVLPARSKTVTFENFQFVSEFQFLVFCFARDSFNIV